jgi:hypothetical protein
VVWHPRDTFPNSRTISLGLSAVPYPINHMPLEAGMSVGLMLIGVDCS